MSSQLTELCKRTGIYLYGQILPPKTRGRHTTRCSMPVGIENVLTGLGDNIYCIITILVTCATMGFSITIILCLLPEGNLELFMGGPHSFLCFSVGT